MFLLNVTFFIFIMIVNRAVQIIECDCHAHVFSKAGSVISSKSPSRALLARCA